MPHILPGNIVMYFVLQKEGVKLEVMVYAPHLTRKFYPNLVLIFAIGISNIFI